MEIGDKVLISPELTQLEGWIAGTIIEIEDNPFVGIVISAETDDDNVFFGREYMFRTVDKALRNGSSCGQCKYHENTGAVEYRNYYCKKKDKNVKAGEASECDLFKFRSDLSLSIADIPKSPIDNLPVRSQAGMCLRTKNQWEKLGYKVKVNETGYELHPTMLNKKTYIYYLSEQVER